MLSLLRRFSLMVFLIQQCFSRKGLASCFVHRLVAFRAFVRTQTKFKSHSLSATPGGSQFTDSAGDQNNNNTSKKTRLISFFTDIEGDRDYLQRYVNRSKVLCWRTQPLDGTVFLDFIDPQGEDMAVFGGDIWDQGGHDLWCLSQLLDFRQRYPDRFHCILGNRDVNKMRLASELHFEKYPGVFWKKGSNEPGDPNGKAMEFESRADRLKHILSTSMGSPRAFEYRRQELQELYPEKVVDDNDVVESYQSHCDPQSGSLIDYIEGSSLMARFGEVAFLHGALPVNKISDWGNLTAVMPWLKHGVSAQDVGVTSVGEWIESLAVFVKEEVGRFRKHGNSSAWIENGGYHGSYGGLIQYGMGFLPDRSPNPTLVYNRWGTRSFAGDEHPRQFWDYDQTEATREFFRNTGIKLICCGHQPNGEMPNTIRVDVDGEPHWIICCDTSYSGDTILANEGRTNPGRESSKSGRGKRAVSEVLIEQCIHTGRLEDVTCHGVLSDGAEYSSSGLQNEKTSFHPDFSVGTESNLNAPCGGKWWTQACLSDGSFLLAASKGFDFWTKIIQ